MGSSWRARRNVAALFVGTHRKGEARVAAARGPRARRADAPTFPVGQQGDEASAARVRGWSASIITARAAAARGAGQVAELEVVGDAEAEEVRRVVGPELHVASAGRRGAPRGWRRGRGGGIGERRARRGPRSGGLVGRRRPEDRERLVATLRHPGHGVGEEGARESVGSAATSAWKSVSSSRRKLSAIALVVTPARRRTAASAGNRRPAPAPTLRRPEPLRGHARRADDEADQRAVPASPVPGHMPAFTGTARAKGARASIHHSHPKSATSAPGARARRRATATRRGGEGCPQHPAAAGRAWRGARTAPPSGRRRSRRGGRRSGRGRSRRAGRDRRAARRAPRWRIRMPSRRRIREDHERGHEMKRRRGARPGREPSSRHARSAGGRRLWTSTSRGATTNGLLLQSRATGRESPAAAAGRGGRAFGRPRTGATRRLRAP